MTLALQSPLPTFVPAPSELKRFTVEEYHRMIDAGAFDIDQELELLEGWLVYKMGHNPPHDVVVKLVASGLDAALPSGWHTRTQSAITTADSEPLPDVAVVQGEVRDYLVRHPHPPDIALLVEVSDTSLDRDRNEKAPLYARAGIPVYWIINISESIVEVYREPIMTGKGGYRKIDRLKPGDSLSLDVAGQSVGPFRVSEMLP